MSECTESVGPCVCVHALVLMLATSIEMLLSRMDQDGIVFGEALRQTHGLIAGDLESRIKVGEWFAVDGASVDSWYFQVAREEARWNAAMSAQKQTQNRRFGKETPHQQGSTKPKASKARSTTAYDATSSSCAKSVVADTSVFGASGARLATLQRQQNEKLHQELTFKPSINKRCVRQRSTHRVR